MSSSSEILNKAMEQASARVTVTKPDVPLHLLWDDADPIMATSTKQPKLKTKKPAKSAGWGLTFVAEAGASAESRGVSNITLAQLPGLVLPQQDVDDGHELEDDHEPPRQAGQRRAGGRRIAEDDDE